MREINAPLENFAADPEQLFAELMPHPQVKTQWNFVNEIMRFGIALAHVPMDFHPVAHLYLSLSPPLSISFLFFLAQRNVASGSSKKLDIRNYG